MELTATILQIILGLMFIMSGFGKFTAKMQVENFKNSYRLPGWFRIVTGLVEIAGAAALIAGIWNTDWAIYGGLIIGVTMLGAVLTHLLRAHDSIGKTIPAFVLMLLAFAAAYINWTL